MAKETSGKSKTTTTKAVVKSKHVHWNGENINEVKKLLPNANIVARLGGRLVVTTKQGSAVVNSGDYIISEGDSVVYKTEKDFNETNG